MILPSQFYEEKLYPLQDGVLNILNRIDSNFFLTGGTALSRAYYNHRYSDDLDLFLNNSQYYDDELNYVLAKLGENGYFWDLKNDFIRTENFATMKVGLAESDCILKLDFVNDMVPHFGKIQETILFKRIDSVRNILSNKLSAIFRYAAKDIADIREIANHEKYDWSEIINEARQKESGLELTYVGEILIGMPKSEFDTIIWTKKPEWDEFKEDINRIVFEMISGENI